MNPPVQPFAVIDIGTNSIRLGVAQPEQGLSYNILTLHKEVVRLGEGEYEENRITPEAMERGLLVLRKFVEVARGFGASDITVLGTSALREAANQGEFVQRAAEEAGVEVHVISGAEEARLIFVGVMSGLDVGSRRVLVMDIGGGSTELAAGDRSGPDLLESMKLGAIRLAGLFTAERTEPIPGSLYRRMQEHARGVAVHSVRRARAAGFDLMYGSSGTILNLAEIVARRKGETLPATSGYQVSLRELEEQAARLCSLSLEQRRRVPGINPERADIIVPGAAVLTAVMRDLGAESLQTSDRALREGILIDRLARLYGSAEAALAEPVRIRSVFQLARRCQFDEAHAQTVARLASSLFEQFRALGLHSLGAVEQELIYYAAILHDIGGFVSYTDHHRHGYYLVRNSPLLGFDETEIRMLAAIVLHHRKGLPRRKEEALADLNRRQCHVVTVLSTLVRLAEAMDRGHLGQVSQVRCSLEDGGRTLVLDLESEGDPQLELWGLANQRKAVQEVFDKRLEVRHSAQPANIPPEV